MQTAIINEHEYILNNYYTETSGRLHLFINNEESYDINQLKEDVETGPVEIIKDEVSCGTFTNYTILRSIDIRVDSDPQIYIITDVESPASLLISVQNQINSLNASTNDLDQELNSLDNRISTLESDTSISELAARITELENSNLSLASRIEELEIIINNLTTSDTDIVQE